MTTEAVSKDRRQWTNNSSHDCGGTASVSETDRGEEIRSLLSELVNTVGAVLTSRPTHVWQLHGGFQRIYEAVIDIFRHGCASTDSQGRIDLWPFIVGLRVLNPVLGPCVEMTVSPRPADDWINTSLKNLQLSSKIAALTADSDHMKRHYHPWALLRSKADTDAVITCLQALEKNSQVLLADIDPKLFVRSYQLSSEKPRAKILEDVKPSRCGLDVWNAILANAVTDDKEECRLHTTSLPTSPVGNKEWENLWSSSGYREKRNSSCVTETFSPYTPSNRRVATSAVSSENITDIMSEEKHCTIGSEIPVKQTISTGKLEHNVTLMRRESPDGSSGGSDWPAASPLSHTSAFSSAKIPQLVTTSSSPTIAELVHGKDASGMKTGARPKDTFARHRLKENPLIVSECLDANDSGSGPGSGISPTLLQVNYGAMSTFSDGEPNNSTFTPGHRGSFSSKTPQLRRRTSSGRLGPVPVDSDVDSEDNVDGSASIASRRRRRLVPSPGQHRSGPSVKMLVDSRGVLVSGSDTRTGDSRNRAQDVTKKVLKLEPGNSELSQSDTACESSKSLSGTESQNAANLSQEKKNVSTPVSTINPPNLVEVASSAPGRVMKSIEAAKAKKKTHGRSHSDGSKEIVGKLGVPSSNTAPTLESGSKSSSGMPIPVRKRFMEDGGHSITPAADYGYFPRPQPGQTLIGFLSSDEFQKQYAELDRENAHFNISEAVITALTQMQFDNWQRHASTSPGAADDSDEEIRNLQARIREKRMLKLSGSVKAAVTSSSAITQSTSDPQQWTEGIPAKIESTTDYSVCESPYSSPYNSESDIISEPDDEDQERLSVIDGAPLTLSRRTSESEYSFVCGLTSAENVAINLLKHFNEQKLPKASELEWLVSEQDVPQKLLPLPTSVAISPDDGSGDKGCQTQTQLRGTSEWAPPRPQLILTLHTKTKHSVLMGTQGWRCAGCGMKVSERLSRLFRLCHYLGRYFCTTCHKNQTAVIPAKVLHKWDFKPYPVANFSYELLERMRSDPLLNVEAVNPRLFKKCRHLHQAQIYRLQLYHTLPYITTCSRANREKKLLEQLPPHWASELNIYSLDDLTALRAGQLVNDVKYVTSKLIYHVADCQVCRGRGFICEICGRGKAIFPFQLDCTSLCSTCNACYHVGCYSPPRCPRCIRREMRRYSHDHLELSGNFESTADDKES